MIYSKLVCFIFFSSFEDTGVGLLFFKINLEYKLKINIYKNITAKNRKIPPMVNIFLAAIKFGSYLIINGAFESSLINLESLYYLNISSPTNMDHVHFVGLLFNFTP